MPDAFAIPLYFLVNSTPFRTSFVPSKVPGSETGTSFNILYFTVTTFFSSVHVISKDIPDAENVPVPPFLKVTVCSIGAFLVAHVPISLLSLLQLVAVATATADTTTNTKIFTNFLPLISLYFFC